MGCPCRKQGVEGSFLAPPNANDEGCKHLALAHTLVLDGASSIGRDDPWLPRTLQAPRGSLLEQREFTDLAAREWN